MNIIGHKLDNNYWNFTPFQVHAARQIENHVQFKKFLMPDLKKIEKVNSEILGPRPVGDYSIAWVDKDNYCRVWFIGEAKIISRVKMKQKVDEHEL